MAKKIDGAAKAAQFCAENGVTVKFQLDGTVRGSYYRPDGLGAVKATGTSFTDFVSGLAAEEQRQDAASAEAERLAEEQAAEAQAAEIAEVEEAVAAFEPVEGMEVGFVAPEDVVVNGETEVLDGDDAELDD